MSNEKKATGWLGWQKGDEQLPFVIGFMIIYYRRSVLTSQYFMESNILAGGFNFF